MAVLPVRLRPFEEDDLAMLERFAVDPEFSSPFEWSGYRWPGDYRRRWEEDGLLGEGQRFLVVADAEDTAVGWVAWRDPELYGQPSRSWEVGIILAPTHRGQGVGTQAQQLLVDYLFETSPIHRITANTEVDNLAEQRALEKSGFVREGVLRQAGFRGGRWRDGIVYARLRDDPGPT